jgi:Na+/H+ antiporter NhaA
MPTHLLDRAVTATVIKIRMIIPHNSFETRLSHLCRLNLEVVCQTHFMLRFMFTSSLFFARRAHHESAGSDDHPFARNIGVGVAIGITIGVAIGITIGVAIYVRVSISVRRVGNAFKAIGAVPGVADADGSVAPHDSAATVT